MKLAPAPGGGGPGWETFARSIIGLFGQQMPRPVWLWPSPFADLPTVADNGANQGALAYDTTADAPTWRDGSGSWQVPLKLSGGAMTGTLISAMTVGGINLETNQETADIPDNGTYDFPTAQAHGMFLIAETKATGQMALCFTNGAAVSIKLESLAGYYTGTSGAAGSVNLFYNSGKVRVENKSLVTTRFKILNAVLG